MQQVVFFVNSVFAISEELMIRSAIYTLGLLGLTSALSFATPIPLGAMADYAVFSSNGFVNNSNFSSGTTTINDSMNAGSQYALGGDAIVFNGGAFNTVLFNGAEYNAFYNLTATLSSVVGTPVVSWVGLTPGDYTFTDPPPTNVSLSGPGNYVFKYVGVTALTFNGAIVTLGAGLSSDDVIWYIPQTVTVQNSEFAGVLVVDGYGATVEANAAATNFNGRVLATNTVALFGWNGGDLAFNNVVGVPEPSSAILVFSGLAVGAIIRRRQSSR